MDLHQKLSALLDVARRLDVTVRQEPLGGDGGGMCLLKGKRVLFIDTTADSATRYERSLTNLAQLPEINGIYVLPELREEFDRVRLREG